MRIALVPIDNRPVCYNLPKEIAAIDDTLELLLPDRKFLGSLTTNANTDAILNWLKKIGQVDAVIVSLDTIAHGGLISSRRSTDTFEEIKSRLDIFKNIFDKNTKIYAFSSIMRISNNNVNEEEKKYWDVWGEKIFEYSFKFHKYMTDKTDVPPEIISDYLATRHRNFQVNKLYTKWFDEGFFSTLVFSKDDCAQYGFNVLEAQHLEDLLKKSSNKSSVGLVKTGADEIPLTLFARAIVDLNGGNENAPKIYPKFLEPEYKDLISNYEDVSIEKSVVGQLELANCKITGEESSDIILLVNNFELHQGEIVMDIKTKEFSRELNLPEKRFMVADVRFANGADKLFVTKLVRRELGSIFYGYSAWNTSANTLGSLICGAIVRFFAKSYNENSFKKLQLVRFLDDWAYQANVRQVLKRQKNQRPDVRKLKKLMVPYEKKLLKIFNVKGNIKYFFPWKRFFEVEVMITSNYFSKD